MKRIAFNTLGCRLNQYETDSLVTEFRDAGYKIVPWNEEADAYLVNTCTVTDRSDRKSRALINQAVRAAGSGARRARETAAGAAECAGSPEKAQAARRVSPVVVVTGCFVENAADGLKADERITYAIDNDRKAGIFRVIDAHLRGEPVDPCKIEAGRFSFRNSARGFHTRSAVKIQDGCDNSCSFCIIPRVRGRGVSRPLSDVLEQVAASVDSGAKEIVITGVNIGRYRYRDAGFSHLLKEVLDLDGDFRVRVSSIEPEAGEPQNRDSWEPGFLELIDHPKLCSHLHLCLQSGSDKILKSMRRRYSVAGFLEFIHTIRIRNPDFNLTTDIIVGFPGETEEDFSETLKVAETAGFSHIHTFPFSVRNGTKAAGMEGQIAYREKVRRAEIVRNLSVANRQAYKDGLVGKRQTVLIEKIENGIARGYGELYVPIEVVITPAGGSGGGTTDAAVNTFMPVRVAGISPGDDPALKGVPDISPV